MITLSERSILRALIGLLDWLLVVEGRTPIITEDSCCQAYTENYHQYIDHN